MMNGVEKGIIINPPIDSKAVVTNGSMYSLLVTVFFRCKTGLTETLLSICETTGLRNLIITRAVSTLNPTIRKKGASHP